MIIYTDGGCLGNPGPGAWAYVSDISGVQVRDAGYEPETTNNRMELQAVIEALRLAKEQASGSVTIFTDSRYVEGGVNEWIQRWEAHGWKTKSRSSVKNRELWEELQGLKRLLEGTGIRVTVKRVPGHSGVELNEECDRLVGEKIAAGRTENL